MKHYENCGAKIWRQVGNEFNESLDPACRGADDDYVGLAYARPIVAEGTREIRLRGTQFVAFDQGGSCILTQTICTKADTSLV